MGAILLILVACLLAGTAAISLLPGTVGGIAFVVLCVAILAGAIILPAWIL